MWYEILPSMILIGSFIYVPQVASWYFNKAVFGNPFRRDLATMWDRRMFMRDCRIDGAPWKIRGLENIPDS